MILNKFWIIKNCPFEMLTICFRRLFPKKEFEAYFQSDLKNDEGEEVFGLTNFQSDGTIEILISTDLTINHAVEIFAHELAHAGVGEGHDHDDVWAKAFEDLFNEYNELGNEMFGSTVDLPSGEGYQEALAEFQIAKEMLKEEDNND